MRVSRLHSGSLRGIDFWFAAYVLILLAQVGRLPLWLSGFAAVLGVLGWIIRRQGRRGIRGRWLAVLALGAAALFWVFYRGQYTVDTAASFLVLTVALKWLELRRRRDLFILFFILCYLVVVTLLFHQSILWAVVLLASLFLLFTGLQVALGASVSGLSGQALRRSGWLFLKMLPVVAVLFLLFPRVGPLWSVPLVSDQATTGLSDEMTPGGITSLVQNDERAFRATFGGEPPPRRQRYWRALILDRFDGRTWSRHDFDEREGLTRVSESAPSDSLEPGEYEVLLEPHGRRWGFGLKDSVPASSNVGMDFRGLPRFERSVDTQTRYRMKRDSETEPKQLSRSGRRFYTQLPEDGNEETREWVARERREAGNKEALVRRFMNHFREKPFHYTLQPPELEDNPVDELLFETRSGFCEHYASALAFMLRTAEIPARIMTGYLGGEPGLNNDYLIVRQYDAHAWVEAWFPDRGWVRLDPTAMIAPERIESGLEAAMSGEGSFLQDDLFSPQRYRDIGWVNWVSLRLDAVNYYWQRWVVGYEGQTQLSLFEKMPGSIGFRELGLITAGAVAFIIGAAVLFSVVQQHRRRFRDPWYRLYDRWCRWLEKRGVPGARHTPVSAQVEAAVAAFPEQAERIRAFGSVMNRVFYQPDTDPGPELKQARQLLARIRRQTIHGRSRTAASSGG